MAAPKRRAALRQMRYISAMPVWVLVAIVGLALVAGFALARDRRARRPPPPAPQATAPVEEAVELPSPSEGPPSPAAAERSSNSSEALELVEPAVGGDPEAQPLVKLAPAVVPSLRFEPLAARGTRSAELALHAPEWRAEMADVGERLASAGVCGVVFVHGTFAGDDPLSASRMVERAIPSIGPYLARTLRKKTRDYVGRVLGDVGHFGRGYVRLFEEAVGARLGRARVPCTDFVWSSENHHVGRLEGALGLVRALATHAELAPGQRPPRPQLLVIGHSHAAQLFALVTQLLARSIATGAILDIARARELDVAALEIDLATLEGASLDFVTFGAPARYAWATVANVRALHVIAVGADGARGGDWIRRLGVDGSDFPPLAGEDRRVNAALAGVLGTATFAPSRLASALRAGGAVPSSGDVVLVDYGDKGLSVSTGFGHGAYTRLDAMLFHARLLADRLYPPPAIASAEAPPPEAPCVQAEPRG